MDSQAPNSSYSQETGGPLQNTTTGRNQRPAQTANNGQGVVAIRQGSNGFVPGNQPLVQASQPALQLHRPYYNPGGVVTQPGFNGFVPYGHMQPQVQASQSAQPRTAYHGQIGGTARPGFDGFVPNEVGYWQAHQPQFNHPGQTDPYVYPTHQPGQPPRGPPSVPHAAVPNFSSAQNVAPQSYYAGQHQLASPYNTGPAFPHNGPRNGPMYNNVRPNSWNHPTGPDGIHQLPHTGSYNGLPVNQLRPHHNGPNGAGTDHSSNIPTSQAPMSAGIPAYGLGVPSYQAISIPHDQMQYIGQQQHGLGQYRGQGQDRGPESHPIRDPILGQHVPGQQQQLPVRTVSMNHEAGLSHASIPGTSEPGSSTEQERTQLPPSTPGPSQLNGSMEQENGQPAPVTPDLSQPGGSVEQELGQPGPSTPGPSQPDGSVEQEYGQPAPSTSGPSQAPAEDTIANGDSDEAIPAHGVQQHQIDLVKERYRQFFRLRYPYLREKAAVALIQVHSYRNIQQYIEDQNIVQQPGPGNQENAQSNAPARSPPSDALFSDAEIALYFPIYLEWYGDAEEYRPEDETA